MAVLVDVVAVLNPKIWMDYRSIASTFAYEFGVGFGRFSPDPIAVVATAICYCWRSRPTKAHYTHCC